MKVQIVAVGRKMPAWVDAAFEEYAKRLPGQKSITLSAVATANRKPGMTVDKCQRQEASHIEKKLRPGSFTIVLDEHGKQWSTAQWAQNYRHWLQHHPEVNFVIGGPDGLADSLLKKADMTIALGRLTMPHGLARVVLIEQLYRAWTVVEGHPYHRE